MAVNKKRTYNSTSRQQQASETRTKIVSAAEKLLLKYGFNKMTFEAIANESGSAVPTVYANFASKADLVKAVIDHARFGEKYQQALETTLKATNPCDQLRNASRIAASIYSTEAHLLSILQSADALSPELGQFAAELETHRFESQKFVIQRLADADLLRSDLDFEKARDIMWTLTSRDIFRSLVNVRKWTVEQYQDWLADTLVSSLVSPEDLSGGESPPKGSK